MSKTPKTLLSELTSNRYKPIYFLQGEEYYYIDYFAKIFENQVITQEHSDFNKTVMYGRDVKVADILAVARRFPMMFERQLTLVKEAQDIEDLSKEKGSKMLMEYIRHPAETTILVFCFKKGKGLDKRTLLGKAVEDLPGCYTFAKMREQELAPFVEGIISQQGLAIAPRAVSLLVDHIGNDLHRLQHELDKIFIDAPVGQPITEEVIMRKVGISREYNNFELLKALLRKDALPLLKMAIYFGDNMQKKTIFPLIAFLFTFFSKLLIAQSLPNKSEQNLMAALGIGKFQLNDYMLGMRQFPAKSVIKILAIIKDADLKTKGISGAKITEEQILKELFLSIARL